MPWTNVRSEALLKADLAGLLIDIADNNGNENAAQVGTDILEKEYKSFKRFLAETSLQYNIGNGKSTLYKIRRKAQGSIFSLASIELLTESKNHYWRAYKMMDRKTINLRNRLLVNLGNDLDTSGRVVEALQYFDYVLKSNPNHANPNYQRN